MLSWGKIRPRYYELQEIISCIILVFSDCFTIVLGKFWFICYTVYVIIVLIQN